MRTRPPRTDDEAAWRGLWRGYLDYYETALPEAQYALTWARLLDPARPHQWGLLAVDGEDRAVGLVHCIEHAHGWREEDTTYLQDLYVAPEARGTGAGRALIEAAYAEADRRGCPSVYWTTQHFNEAGRRLYDRVAALTPFIKYQRP